MNGYERFHVIRGTLAKGAAVDGYDSFCDHLDLTLYTQDWRTGHLN